MSLARRIPILDVLGLLVAVATVIASLIVWDDGTVNLGFTLTEADGRVVVHDVTPDGHAARRYVSPWSRVLELRTVDGSAVVRGDPLSVMVQPGVTTTDAFAWQPFPSLGGDEIVIDADHRPPVEAVAASRIEAIVLGDVEPTEGAVFMYDAFTRSEFGVQLRQSIWILLLGIAVGLVTWRVLAHGIAGDAGRRLSILLGTAVAIPFLVLPLNQVGHPIGLFAGFLVPAGVAVLVGIRLARLHPDRAWFQTGVIAAVLAGGLVAVLVTRYMTSPVLLQNDRSLIFMTIASCTLIPAIIAVAAPGRMLPHRVRLLGLALLPVAAVTLYSSASRDAATPMALVGGLLAVQVLPFRPVAGYLERTSDRLRSRPPAIQTPSEPLMVERRDQVAFVVLALVVAFAITQPDAWALVLGLGLAGLVGLAMRRGFLGESWTDAAVPLAVAAATPVILLAAPYRSIEATFPSAIAALLVAHVLARRHSDPSSGNRLFALSVITAFVVAVLVLANVAVAIVLVGLVALIPAFPLVAGQLPGEARALTWKLEVIAVAATPGAAVTVLVSNTNGMLLAGWLVAIVIWRQFTLNPLVGMAERTQLQRDVAVAAAETERARLAADLHDDALQQLTMLVRTLDEGGQKAAADEAREIATKLRSVVGDLRLPILDDLGAGAALEWLVERVEPLAGGPVKLERSDETRPPANVELAVFRVAQEALTNAIKHGRPPIAVRYDVRADGRVTLAIDDAGEGIGSEAAEEAPKEGHFGLVNMQQRAEQIGALLDVRRWPAGGTRVALEWRPVGT